MVYYCPKFLTGLNCLVAAWGTPSRPGWSTPWSLRSAMPLAVPPLTRSCDIWSRTSTNWSRRVWRQNIPNYGCLYIYILNPPHQDRICLGVLVKSTVVANFELCRCHGATARSKYIANTWETKEIGPGCESLTNWRLATTANVFVTFVKLQILGCNYVLFPPTAFDTTPNYTFPNKGLESYFLLKYGLC